MRISLPHTATYWPKGDPDGYGGFAYGSPVEIPARWEERGELFRDDQGREVTSQSVVYLDRPVDKGGYLALGKWTEADPREVLAAREVRQFESIPSVDGRRVVRRAML